MRSVSFRPIADIRVLGQSSRMLSYGDTVIVRDDAPAGMRPGQKASVVGITTEPQRSGSHFEQFPQGTVYLVEFGDGEAFDLHESMLTAIS